QPVLPRPQLVAPSEPVPFQLQLDQLVGRSGSVEQKAAPLPFAARRVEDLKVGFQIAGLPQTTTGALAPRQPTTPPPQLALPAEARNAEVQPSQLPLRSHRMEQKSAPLPY